MINRLEEFSSAQEDLLEAFRLCDSKNTRIADLIDNDPRLTSIYTNLFQPNRVITDSDIVYVHNKYTICNLPIAYLIFTNELFESQIGKKVFTGVKFEEREKHYEDFFILINQLI